jgi:hypothetical protein
MKRPSASIAQGARTGDVCILLITRTRPTILGPLLVRPFNEAEARASDAFLLTVKARPSGRQNSSLLISKENSRASNLVRFSVYRQRSVDFSRHRLCSALRADTGKTVSIRSTTRSRSLYNPGSARTGILLEAKGKIDFMFDENDKLYWWIDPKKNPAIQMEAQRRWRSLWAARSSGTRKPRRAIAD